MADAAAAPAVDEHVIVEAKQLAKLPFLADFDPEVVTAAVRQTVEQNGSPVGPESLLQSVFIAIGWDKAAPAPAPAPAPADDDEDGEEGGDGAEQEAAGDDEAGDDAEEGKDDEGEDGEDGDASSSSSSLSAAAGDDAAPAEATNNAMDVWRVLVGEDAEEEADVRELMAKLAVRLRGYGDAQLRFAVGLADPDGSSGVDEDGLWRALTATAPEPLQGVKREHMRRLWREAETWMPAAPEELTGDEEDAEAAMEAYAAANEARERAKSAPRRVVVESWLEKLAEDEFAASLLLPEVEVPKEDEKQDNDGEGEEDDDA